MNVELAKTFLEIVAMGNFASAAERLHVTQSTVSMRVRSLEDQLGRTLFTRTKAGASLTTAGEQFQRYATAFIQIWEQAQHNVGVPTGYETMLAIGGQFSLWDTVLLKWLTWMRHNAPEIFIRAEYGLPEWLMQRVIEGIIDVAVLFTPQSRPGLKVEVLFEEELELVSTDPKRRLMPRSDFVYIDWGPDFRRRLMLTYPEIVSAGPILDLGSLALRYVLDHGGTAFFPKRVIEPHLASGKLHRVPTRLHFNLPAYAVYSESGNIELFERVVSEIRTLSTTTPNN
tara:strand:+ start:2190 stop:3044 length:855 start_codon:yes stop_codon:yes gene_type:complete